MTPPDMAKVEIIRITFAPPGKRALTVISRSNCKAAYKEPSPVKLGRMVHCKSLGEANLCILLECDPHVVTYREQPCEIVYTVDGQEYRHYPDFEEKRDDGTVRLVENKTSKDAESEEIKYRTAIMRAKLPQHGYEYELAIAEEGAREPRLRNSSTMVYFGGRPVELPEREMLRRSFMVNERLTWGNASAGQYGPYGREILCRLVLERVLTYDAELPLSEDTIFQPQKGL